MDFRSIAINFVVTTLAVACLSISVNILYNLFFHPLRRFPGPKLWAASRAPWSYHQLRGQLHLRLLAVHNEYGATVRVAPNELSFTDPEAWTSIYAQRGDEMAKDPIFRLHTPTGAQNILVADRDTHSRQRRLLAHAFSESALREQEPTLRLYADKLIAQLRRRSASGPVDMVAWLTFTTFDLIGHMAFGENFACLDAGKPAPFVDAVSAMATELTLTQLCKYWRVGSGRVAALLRRLFTPRGLVAQGQRQRALQIRAAMATVRRRIARGGSGGPARDFLHYILAANETSRAMSAAELDVNAFSLSIAGSESTATALAGALFLLLTHPGSLARAVDEVRGAHRGSSSSPSSPFGAAAAVDGVTLASTARLPYLNAVIDETLRLYPPVAIAMPRVVPRGSGAAGVVIAGRVVPAGTTVGVPHWAASRFRQPGEFAPERWLRSEAAMGGGRGGGSARGNGGVDERDDDGSHPHRHHHHDHPDHASCSRPFSLGPRGCLGKNLARAEVRLVLAELLLAFDWRLEPGQEGWMREQRLRGFWVKPPLWCGLTPVGGGEPSRWDGAG